MNPPSQIRTLFPALNNPAKRHRAVGFTPEQFHYAFTNTLSRGGVASRPTTGTPSPPPGCWVWDYGLIANFKPGHQETWVDYEQRPRAAAVHRRRRRPHHAALGEQVELQAVQQVAALTEYVEFEGRDHWTCAEPGWEAIADKALDWALEPRGPTGPGP